MSGEISGLSIVGISGSVSRPSRTATVVQKLLEALEGQGDISFLDFHEIGSRIGTVLPRTTPPGDVEAMIRVIETADILVVGSPVYRASYPGLLKHLFDLVHFEALKGKVVVLAATGGTLRHTLMIEHQFRPLFGFFGAITVPTGIYAEQDDFTDFEIANPQVIDRIELAARQAVALARSGRFVSPQLSAAE